MPQQIKPKRDKKEERAAEEAKKAADAAAAASAAQPTGQPEVLSPEDEVAAQVAAQDEFQVKGFELVEWVQDNRGIVLGFLGAVVVAGLGLGIYGVTRHGNDTEASADWAKALVIWDAPVGTDPDPADDVAAYATDDEKSKAARTAFEGVVSKHKGTGGANLASLYVGHAALKQKDYDGAIAAYQAFLDGGKATDSLRFAGLDGLAAAKEEKGDIKGAILALEAIVALESKTDEDGALLNLGRLYKKDGDDAKARARLDTLLADYPETTLKPRADEILATLSGTPTPKPAATETKTP